MIKNETIKILIKLRRPNVRSSTFVYNAEETPGPLSRRFSTLRGEARGVLWCLGFLSQPRPLPRCSAHLSLDLAWQHLDGGKRIVDARRTDGRGLLKYLSSRGFHTRGGKPRRSRIDRLNK